MEANREIWKSIDEYANYEVSCFGRVRNATTARILKPCLSGCGYMLVNLYKNKKAKSHRVHVLIAHEWIENPSGKLCVVHIDGNKQNSCIENLRWATISENQGNRIKQHNPSSSIYKGVSFHKR